MTHAAPVEGAFVEHLAIGRCFCRRLNGFSFLPPQLARRHFAGQGMDQQAPKILVTAAEPGFDHEVETDLVERASADGIVEAAQGDCRFVAMAAATFVEEPLGDGGLKAALLRPRSRKPLVAIEIKRNSAPKIGHGFTIACDDLGVANRFVVSSGDETYPTKGNITVHSLTSACSAVSELFRPPFR